MMPLNPHLVAVEAICSSALFDSEGRYTGEMDVYAYGPYKAEIMRQVADREGIDLAASYAYSDSYTDLPMLEAVGHPVVVNPERVLLKVAKDRDWDVRSFVHPVRLRDRMPAPRPGPTAAFGGVAALVIGLVVWWRVQVRRPVPPPPASAGVREAIRRAASWPRRRRER